MTEAEILELVSLYYGNAIEAFTIYITFTFAYLTVAYFVGSKLTRFQVFVVSGLYLISALSTTLGSIMPMLAWGELLANRDTLLSKFPVWDGEMWVVNMGIIFLVGIVVSFYFMYDVRSKSVQG
ncbi:MAG: hypothetical protein RIC85_04720 [Gammaproteobacteria bacterium]